jgi:hypothetical protein
MSLTFVVGLFRVIINCVVRQDGVWEAPMITNPDCEKYGCGEWKRPKMKNPAYKGKWKRPKITNPAYKGPWKARQLPNPAYFEDFTPARGLAPMAGIAVEVWTINAGIHFDNFVIAHSLSDAFAFADETFSLKQTAEGVKEKKDLKKKKEEGRADKKKNGSSKDKAMIAATELGEALTDVVEANPAAAAATGLATLLLLAFLCWPTSNGNRKRRAAPPVSETVSEPAGSPAPVMEAVSPASTESCPAVIATSSVDNDAEVKAKQRQE